MRRYWFFCGLIILFLFSAALPPVLAQVTETIPSSKQGIEQIQIASEFAPAAQLSQNYQSQEQAGRQLYESGLYADAIDRWESAIAELEGLSTDAAVVEQVAVLSNLSLAHQQLGDWQAADARIQAALELFNRLEANASDDVLLVKAQTLDILGRLQLVRGNAEAALTTWEQAGNLYIVQTETSRLVQNRLNQARALQALGLYLRARHLLGEVNQTLDDQPDLPIKIQALQSLGNLLRVVGEFDRSNQVLDEALSLAERSSDVQAISEIQLSLGNTAQMMGDLAVALDYYQAAAMTDAVPIVGTVADPAAVTSITAQLRQLALLLKTGEIATAQALWPNILSQLDQLPEGRPAVYARVELGRSLTSLARDQPAVAEPAAQLLAIAVQQAQRLVDQQATSYALGTLGELYATNRQIDEAETLIRQALSLSEAINAPDISYRWYWQLGRLLATQGEREAAIAAYQAAVNLLETLRQDLVAVNPDVQFSFRTDVEPVYRELVDLLLQTGQTVDDSIVNQIQDLQEELQADLRQARQTIELLQIAELDNFFREACLLPKQDLDRIVDQTNPQAAVLYAIILPDRLEVVIKLPNQLLRHYAAPVSQAQVEQTIADLRQGLARPFGLKQTQQLSQTVYNWLIQPIATELEQNDIKTLVFVLDGVLRGIPMAALYDGETYLIEKYAIALTPGLQLTNPQLIEDISIDTLAAGLTEARQDFSALPNVQAELEQIQTAVNSKVLLNDQFTASNLQQQVTDEDYTVLHLATHGQFSSQADDTFILAWDQKILVHAMDTLLRDRDQLQPVALELLVLSACETAEGDQQAALGLAGVAVRAGARSTVASLWAVPDDSTAILMRDFYEALATSEKSRAEILRQAQLALLKSAQYSHPRNWAAFVLVGSWL